MIEDANAVMSNLQPNPIGLAHSTGGSGIRYSLYSDPTIMGAGEDNDFNALSPCQWKQYYSYFAFEEDRPAEIIGIACTLPYVLQPTEIIPTGEQRVWNTAQILDRHIIIEPNASLTINCAVLAAPDATIQVRRGAKLTIQHGSIRRLCEDTPWKSIWVEGAYNQAHPNVDEQNYQLFPNPAQEYINLVYPFTERPLQLQLTGLYDGRVHLQVQLPIGSTHALGTQDLSNGLYQVTFFDPERGEVLYSSRIVIIK